LAEDLGYLPSSYESMFDRAHMLADSGDVNGAIALLERIHARLGRLSEATLRQNPPLQTLAYTVVMHLSELFAEQQRYDDAIRVTESWRGRLPTSAEDLEREVVVLLAAKGDLDEALARALSIAERRATARNLVLVAEVQAALKQFEQAAASLDRAESVATDQPEKAFMQYVRYTHLAAQDRLPEALKAWDRAVELHPGLTHILADELYTFLLESGAHEQLRRYLRKDASDMRAELYRGLLEYASGDYASARSHWEAVVKSAPEEEDVVGALAWGEAALRLGRYEEALDILLNVANLAADPHCLLLLSAAAFRAGRTQIARHALADGARVLRISSPRRERYSPSDWELFSSVVDNRDVWPSVIGYFDTGDAS